MWCALRIFIVILTEDVPMTRIHLVINFNNLNLIVIQFYSMQKLNLILIPGRLQSSWH